MAFNGLKAILPLLVVAGTVRAETVSPEIPPEFEHASAIVLEDSRVWEVIPGKKAEYRVKRRTLVIDPRGFSEADQAIPYNTGTTKLASFSARTLLPNGDVVPVSEDLQNDILVYKSEDTEWRSRQFTFPAVSPGAVLELEYRIHATEPRLWKVWDVQRTIPVLKANFGIELRQPATYVPLVIRWHPRGTNQANCRKTEQSSTARNHVLRLNCENLPAFESEENAPPDSDIQLRFDFVWGHDGIVNDWWLSVGNSWLTPIDKFLAKRTRTKTLAMQITKGATSESEKTDRVFDWIKRNLVVRTGGDSFGGGVQFNYHNVDEVVDHGGGTSVEIAVTAMALLRDSGLSVNPVVARNQMAGRFIYGALDRVNHLMLEVRMDDRLSILDPSCFHCQPGMTDWRYVAAEGASGIRLAPIPGRPLSLAVVPARYNLESRTERVEIDETGLASVNGRALWLGQFSIFLRSRWEDLDEVSRREDFLSNYSRSVEDPMTKFSDPEETFEELAVSYEYRSEMPVTSDGRLLIRPMDTFVEKLDIPIQEERVHPLWFPFKFSVASQTVFELPEGYGYDIPYDERTIEGPSMRFSSRWQPGGNAREVIWSGALTLDTIEVPPDFYAEAQEFARRVAHELRGGLVAKREPR